jgi:hypothetical protein
MNRALGSPRTITDDQIEVRTLEATPKGRTHWSTRAMAKQVGLSHSTIGRIWRTFGLKPHRSKICISRRRTPRGSTRSSASSACLLRELCSAARTTDFIAAHNAEAKPFSWKKTADEILDSMRRFASRTLTAHQPSLLEGSLETGH